MMLHVDPQALRVIASLQRPGKPVLLNRIVERLKSEVPESIDVVQQGLDAGDLSACVTLGHGVDEWYQSRVRKLERHVSTSA